jgi:hypothetical protein
VDHPSPHLVPDVLAETAAFLEEVGRRVYQDHSHRFMLAHASGERARACGKVDILWR